MPLLLDRGPKLQKLLWHWLVGRFEYIDQGTRLCFIMLCEEGYG